MTYKRILLKLSGEALMGNKPYGIDPAIVQSIAEDVSNVISNNVQLAIVVGGGNIFRGLKGSADGMDRATADYVGMLATVMNAISLQDGRKIGDTAAFSELFPVYTPDLDHRRGLIPGGGVYRPESVVVAPASKGTMLVYRRNGDMAMYSIENSTSQEVPEVLWKQSGLMHRIYEVVQNESSIAIAGRSRTNSPSGGSIDYPNVLILDALTGNVIADFVPSSREDVRWVKFAPNGMLLVGTRSGIEARTLQESEPLVWVSSARQHRGTTRDRVVSFGNNLVAVRSPTSMSAIDLTTGEVVPDSFELPVFESGDESTACLMVSTDNDGITVLMNNKILRWDIQGEITGIDAISGNPSLLGLFNSRDYDLVLEEMSRSSRSATRTYWLHRIDPSAGLRITGPQLEFESQNRSIGTVEICPGWVLIQNGSDVLAISMPF